MRRLLTVLALVGAASCSSPFEPAGLAGTYEASQIAGRAVPFSIHDGERTIHVIADSIILRPDGTGRMGSVVELTDDAPGSPTVVQHFTGELVYEIRGSTLEVTDVSCTDICSLALVPPLEYLIVGSSLIRDNSSWQRRADIE